MLPPLKALEAVLLGLLPELVLGVLAGLALGAAACVELLNALEGAGEGLGTFCRALPAVLVTRGVDATDLRPRVKCSTPGMASRATTAITATLMQPWCRYGCWLGIAPP